MGRYLLIDISNSFTKVAIAGPKGVGRVRRIPTGELNSEYLLKITGSKLYEKVVLSSVVPGKNTAILSAFPDALLVGPHLDLGVGIDYPAPSTIGADRLANAAACAELGKFPTIVVDFGTAVTFDVLSPKGDYIGGVIAPGLSAMTHYLHERTALLPHITLREPKFAIGRSTREAMLSGAFHGYRGLIRGIVENIQAEAFAKKRPFLLATGGDALLIAKGTKFFDLVDPLLTLRGLLSIAKRN
jgi:type III pantothenate kinase